MKNSAAGHLSAMLKRYPSLEPLRSTIESAHELLAECVLAGGKLLLCGNGGSAADADHWAGELLKGFGLPRPVDPCPELGLDETIASNLQGGISAISLCAFPALLSAFGNDVNPEYAYAQLVWALGCPGDVLVGISTSGNAKNVLQAARVARAKRMRVLGLSGETGGQLRRLCDMCLCVPANVTHQVQELHLPVYHALSLMLEEEVFGG